MTRYRIVGTALAATLDDATVVLDMGANRYYTLNETGAFIWGLLETGATEEEIVLQVTIAFEVSEAEARTSVAALLADLRAHTLIEEAGP